jgi:hypothetical protein
VRTRDSQACRAPSGEVERCSKLGYSVGLWAALARSIAFAHSATAKQYCPSSSTAARQFVELDKGVRQVGDKNSDSGHVTGNQMATANGKTQSRLRALRFTMPQRFMCGLSRKTTRCVNAVATRGRETILPGLLPCY